MRSERNGGWFATPVWVPREGAEIEAPAGVRVIGPEGNKYTLEPIQDMECVGARLEDPADDFVYVVKIDTKSPRPRVTSLEVVAPSGASVDQSRLGRLNTRDLAEAAQQMVRFASGQRPGNLVAILPEGFRRRGGLPDLQALAQEYGSGEKAEVLADYMSRYDVSRATVHRWIRAARDKGYLAEPETGRPRNHKTTKEQE